MERQTYATAAPRVPMAVCSGFYWLYVSGRHGFGPMRRRALMLQLACHAHGPVTACLHRQLATVRQTPSPSDHFTTVGQGVLLNKLMDKD